MFLLIEIIDHVVREQINLEGVKKISCIINK